MRCPHLEALFENLGERDYDHSSVSDPTPRYNCLAWAAGDDQKRWWPIDLADWGWPPNLMMEEGLAAGPCVMYCPCGMKTITIDDEAYNILRRLKQGKTDSFTRVIKRNYQTFDTCGELIDWIESQPAPKIYRERLRNVKQSRGQRSKREF